MKPSPFACAVLPIAGILLTGVLSGCGTSEITGQTPKVLASVSSTVPSDGQTGVSVDSTISALFLANLTPEALRLVTLTVTRAGQVVGGNVVLDTRRARFIPATRLSGHTRYDCALLTEIFLHDGDLERGYRTWSITTGDSTPLPGPIVTAPRD